MRNVIDNAKKHWKNLSIHLKKHHKKYLFGAFGWFALVKIFFLLLWLMPVTNIKNIFADYNEWIILDSNNLETYCEISEQETDITCNYDTARNVNIIGVNPWAFNNYKHTLLNLNLSGNKIQSIESWTFTELTRLQLVILDNNQIYHISAEDFIWLNENLKISLNNNCLSSDEITSLTHFVQLTPNTQKLCLYVDYYPQWEEWTSWAVRATLTLTGNSILLTNYTITNDPLSFRENGTDIFDVRYLQEQTIETYHNSDPDIINYPENGEFPAIVTWIDQDSPICGERLYEPSLSTRSTWIKATLFNSYDNWVWIDISGWTCELTQNGVPCEVLVSDLIWNTKYCTTVYPERIDNEKPTVSFNLTSGTWSSFTVKVSSDDGISWLEDWSKLYYKRQMWNSTCSDDNWQSEFLINNKYREVTLWSTSNDWTYYLCIKENSLSDRAGNWNYATIAGPFILNNTAPSCEWQTTTETSLNIWETWLITLECTDTSAPITTYNLYSSDIEYDYNVINIDTATTWNITDGISYTFVYTAINSWNTTLVLKTWAIQNDIENSNTSSVTSESIIVVWEDETWHNSSSCERLMQFVQTPYSSWTQSDTVEIELFCGSIWRWAFSTTNVWVDIRDGTDFENGHLLLTTTWESFNGQYVCAYAQTWERVETGCTNYPFMVDAFNPEIDLLSPNNWASFESWDSIILSRSWLDLTSWISWYVLEINKPNGEDILKYFDVDTTSTWIVLDIAWRWNRSVRAYDKAERSNIETRFFDVTYSGGNNSGNNNWTGGNGTGGNGSWTVETWFYLISPALFDRISLWTDIRFRRQAWESNSWYEISVEKIRWDVIYSGFTTGTTIVVDSWYFSAWAYSRSVKDISTETTKTISMFYVVDLDNLPDLKVDNFEFNEIRNADINEYYKSNWIIINWLEDWWFNFAYLKDNKGALFINDEFVWTQWFVTNEDKVRIELLSSSWYSTTVSATLIIGAADNLVSGDFKVTTKDWINGWEDPLLTPLQRLWWIVFVDSLVEMYQNDPAKLATFLSTFMQLLQDKSDYYAQEILDAQADWNEELVNEYRTYKNAIDFLYTTVAYRYDHIEVEDRTVYIAPNGKQYLVEYNEERMAYTSPDFARVKYFPTWELFTNHIDMNNPAVWKWWIVGNVITTHNGKVYTIYETNGKWTSSNFKTAKYFDTKEDIINHILANNPASNWNHTVDPDFEQVTYTAPNGKVYKIFKTSSKWNNPNMYSSYNFVNAKYFTSLEAAKKFINQNNK